MNSLSTGKLDEDVRAKTLRRENTEDIIGGKQTAPFLRVLGCKQGWKYKLK